MSYNRLPAMLMNAVSCLQKGTMVQLQSRHAAGDQHPGAGPSNTDVNMEDGDPDLARALAASLAGANAQAAASAGDPS